MSDQTSTITLTPDDILRLRRAKGGRASDRIGKGMEYVAHSTPFGAAAARRRRQMRKTGTFGCRACGEPTHHSRLYLTSNRLLICEDCIAAAGLELPTSHANDPAPAPHDHDLHAWEGEGGAPSELEQP